MKKIVHIAPALPPLINGLGDFCNLLVNNLEAEGYTDNVFIVRADAGKKDRRNVYTFEPETFSDRLNHHVADTLILHYVGYAYHKLGLPYYLVDGIRSYKQRLGCRILVFFHELYSSSKSAFRLPFYTNVFQKSIVRQLCRLSDATFTNCNHYSNLLKEVAQSNSFRPICTGIFSNIPDDLFDKQALKEEDSLIVFGSLPRRNAVYNNCNFLEVLKRLKVRKLYDAGPGKIQFAQEGIDVHILGALTTEALAHYLNLAKFGALSYKPELLGKSGIFSAFAAFGIIPINLLETGQPLNDGLIKGKNYFNCKMILDDGNLRIDSYKHEMLTWYQTRNQKAVTLKVKEHL